MFDPDEDGVDADDFRRALRNLTHAGLHVQIFSNVVVPLFCLIFTNLRKILQNNLTKLAKSAQGQRVKDQGYLVKKII